MALGMRMLMTPQAFKPKYKVKPKKPKPTGNKIKDLWFYAQWELACGKQPKLLEEENILIQMYAGRNRAPTTHKQIQELIDTTTSVSTRNLVKNEVDEDADLSDDEQSEHDDEHSTKHGPRLLPTISVESRGRQNSQSNPSTPTSPINDYSGWKPEEISDLIGKLWFMSQHQLMDGIHPTVLNKYGGGYRIKNMKKYNPRYRKHHKKVSKQLYLSLDLDNLTQKRNFIDKDEDEDGDKSNVNSPKSRSVKSPEFFNSNNNTPNTSTKSNNNSNNNTPNTSTSNNNNNNNNTNSPIYKTSEILSDIDVMGVVTVPIIKPLELSNSTTQENDEKNIMSKVDNYTIDKYKD